MFDYLISGIIIEKHTYGAPESKTPTITKQNAILYEGAADFAQARPDDGEWILRVQGIDKHGKPLTQNKYVDEMTYNCTSVGDKWPITSQV